MHRTFGGALEQPDGALLTDDPFPHGRQSTAQPVKRGLEAEALPDDRPDALRDDLRVVVPVDHDPASIRTECAVGVAHGGVELGAGSFEAVTRRVTPGRGDRLV